MTIWVDGVFFNVLKDWWPSTNGVILVQLLFTIICFFAFGLFAVNINLVQDFGPWYFFRWKYAFSHKSDSAQQGELTPLSDRT